MRFPTIYKTLGSALQSKGLWLIAGLMFLGKMLWFLYWGTLLEVDSVGYLQLQTALYHPPGYVVFCGLIVRLFGYVEAIVVVQAALLSFSVGLLLSRYIKQIKWQWIIGIALAIDPCTGLLCADIMAEAVFLALLMFAFCAVPSLITSSGRNADWAAGFIGVMMGLAYVTRYAAPIYMVALILILFLAKMPWNRILLAGFWMILAFQMVLLPLRMYYYRQFGTVNFNAYTELSIFNSAAYLYPDSKLKGSPETDFESLLSASPDSVFEMKHTWYTNHFFNGEWPYQIHTKNLSTSQALDAAKSAGRTGIKLIAESPFQHLKAFVIPNIGRPFWHRHQIYADRLPPLIEYPIGFQKTMKFDYEPIMTWLVFALMLLSTGIQVKYRNRMPWLPAFLLLSSWLYLGAISMLAVFFLRFVYMLMPIVLVGLTVQISAFWEGRE